MINVKQIAKFVVGLGDKASASKPAQLSLSFVACLSDPLHPSIRPPMNAPSLNP